MNDIQLCLSLNDDWINDSDEHMSNIEYHPDPERPFENLGFEYQLHDVVYESYVSKWDGCVLWVNWIDGKRYPFEHRTQGSAEAAACRIIDRLTL